MSDTKFELIFANEKCVQKRLYKKKKKPSSVCLQVFNVVGMTGFEPATPRPPDVYSNRTELHPDIGQI